MNLQNPLFRRPVHQTLQGIIMGSFSRLTGAYEIPVLYGVGKYALNKALEQEKIDEKHSALKKAGWYALGVCLAHADKLYAAYKLMET
ncbi:hypothetical protein C4573_06110 [Candidatus Woesearchaeota archaeon]|nr:MAG: hypothetical protein C4573_06110 [Candidatus Woesearchaeota archaeon]